MRKTKQNKKQKGGNFHLAKDRIRIFEGNEPAAADPTRVKKNGKTRKSRKFKPMSCSPIVDGKTPVKGSCFTRETLEQIWTAYNASHPDDVITADTPEEVWIMLKSRLHNCSTEDCWLGLIKDDETRSKIDEYTFAPDQPPDWRGKGKEDQWLSNFDIFNVIKQYEVVYPAFKLIGPSPIDFDARPKGSSRCVWEELCDFQLSDYVGKYSKIGVVFNLDKHNKGGSHWVSMFIDLEDQFIFYLDSAGDKIPKEINAFVKRVIKQGLAMSPPLKLHFYENCPTEHQYGESECGMYGLFFIITMLTGKVDGKSFSDYNEKIDFFKVKRISDSYVTKFRRVYFNVPASFPKKK
jgi:hypothetical protein